MGASDQHDQLDRLALQVERQIAATEKFLDDLNDFAPRSERSRKLKQQAQQQS